MKTTGIRPGDLREMKHKGTKISAVVTYSFTMARLADEAGVDAILSGDSVARVVYGHTKFLTVGLDQMIAHTCAIARASKRACVIADLPQKTMAVGINASVEGAYALMAEGGAHLIKVEGGSDYVHRVVTAIAEAGIPVVGHIGMPSSHIDEPGQYVVRSEGNTEGFTDPNAMVELGSRFQSAGCSALLLAKVRPDIASEITRALEIPTIGNGSGPGCDGQILVLEDIVGLTEREPPYYLKTYAWLATPVRKAIKTYVEEVRQGIYPGESHASPT